MRNVHSVADGQGGQVFARSSGNEGCSSRFRRSARGGVAMIYGYEYMRPKPPSAAEVLRLASAVPSLQAYLLQVANPNSIYVGIRDAAWQQMQSTGSTIADPRVVANLERARGMPAKGKFVMVNSATQMLYMIAFEESVDDELPVRSHLVRVAPVEMLPAEREGVEVRRQVAAR